MPTYRFITPQRVETPLDEVHPLFRRVRNRQGVALVQHPDETWEEFADLPSIFDANADYMFGRTDRSSVPAGKGAGVSTDHVGVALETPEDREFRSPLRIYRGGHVYHIDATLKAELEAAVTDEEANGYGDYIEGPIDLGGVYEDVYDDVYSGYAIRRGDEVLVSGRTPEYEQPNTI